MYYFISYMLCNVRDTQFRQSQLSTADFAIVAKDGLFWPSIVVSSQLIYDVTRTCGTGHFRRLSLYAQIGPNAIFNND